jgi:hypothetical protein
LPDSILPEPESAPIDWSVEAGLQNNQKYRGNIGSAAQGAKDGSWFDLGDVALAAPRGAIDAVHGVYGLANTLTGGALPDWESPLGHSHTFLGSALEGIAQFATGFLPLGGFGGIPFTGGLGAFSGLLPELAEGAGLAANVGRAALGTGITAFAAFEGHDKRLSDLVQSVPAIQNPISAFLASNESDSELYGRLKNSLEQAGLAAALEPLFYGLKTFKAKRAAATEKGATAETVASAGGEHADDIRKGLQSLDEGTPPSGSEAVFQDALAKLRAQPETFRNAAGKSSADIEQEFFAKLQTNDEAKRTFARNVSQDLPEPGSPNAPAEFGPESTSGVPAATGGEATADVPHSEAPAQPVTGGSAIPGDIPEHQQLAHEISPNPEQLRAALSGAPKGPAGPDAVRKALLNIQNVAEGANTVASREGGSALEGVNVDDLRNQTYQTLAKKAFPNAESMWDYDEALKQSKLGDQSTWGQDPSAVIKQAQDLVDYALKGDFPKVPKLLAAPVSEGAAEAPKAHEVPVETAAPTVEERQTWGLKTLGFDEAAIKNLRERMATKEGNAPHLFTPEGAEFGPDVRNLPETDRLLAGISERDTPITAFKNADGVPVYISAMSEAILPAIRKDFTALDPHTIAKMNDEAFKAVSDAVGGSPERVKEAMLRRVHAGVDQVAEEGAVARSGKTLLDIQARQNIEHMELIDKIAAKTVEGNQDLELVRMDYNTRYHAALQLGVQGMYSELGRALRGAADITTGMSMGDFLSKAAEAGGFTNRLPEFDAALASNPEALAARMNELGGRDFLMGQKAKMQAAYAAGGPDAVAKLARMSTLSRVAAMTKEYWISALLGSPKTILVNILSQTGNSIYGPYEKMMGSQLVKGAAKLRGNAIEAAAQDPVMRAAVAQAKEMTQSLPQIMQLGKVALKQDVYAFGKGNDLLGAAANAPAITAETAGLDPNSVGGTMINWLGKFMRLSPTILRRSDQVLGQVNARTYAMSWLGEEALAKGLPVAEHPQYIADRMDQLITGNQFKTLAGVKQQALEEAVAKGLTDPKQVLDYQAKRIQALFPENDQILVQKAVAYARDRNFTTPAEPNSVSWFLQRMAAQHPMMTAIMPFINTPINLLKWTGQRLDAYGLASYMTGKDEALFEVLKTNANGTLATTKNRFLREMLSGDPEQKANAVGRLATGAGLATLAATAAFNKVITGRGPEDPNERKAWLAAGNLPYSVKTSAGQVQFSRLDPVATMFGAAADVVDTIRHMTEEDQPFAKALMHGLGTAFANNITQRSYLSGIQKISEVLTDPDKNMGNYLQSFAGSFVPNSLNAATGPAGDDYTREIGGMVDAIRARLPGLSTSLPPQRNLIGEPIQRTTAVGSESVNRWADFILPVAAKRTSDDVVTNELGRLAYPFSQLSKTVNGQDLTQVPVGETNAYDRWGELTGTVKLGGDTLREKLRRLIGSRQYQALEPDIIDKRLSPRAELINNTIHDYRARAFEQLQQENPKLRAYNQTYVNNRQRLRYGLQPSILPVVTGE